MPTPQPSNSARVLKRNEEKWTAPLMDAGWTAVPSIILEKQQALGLDPIDVNILLHLARHWWFSDILPHPSKATMAQCMGIDPSTVRRHIAQMEKDGLIQRRARYDSKTGGQTSNYYEFDGLIKEATPFALEAVEIRENHREQDEQRKRRKKPQLVVKNAQSKGKTGGKG